MTWLSFSTSLPCVTQLTLPSVTSFVSPKWMCLQESKNLLSRQNHTWEYYKRKSVLLVSRDRLHFSIHRQELGLRVRAFDLHERRNIWRNHLKNIRSLSLISCNNLWRSNFTNKDLLFLLTLLKRCESSWVEYRSNCTSRLSSKIMSFLTLMIFGIFFTVVSSVSSSLSSSSQTSLPSFFHQE